MELVSFLPCQQVGRLKHLHLHGRPPHPPRSSKTAVPFMTSRGLSAPVSFILLCSHQVLSLRSFVVPKE